MEHKKREHEITSEEGSKEIKCVDCNEKFELEDNFIEHIDDDQECDHCRDGFVEQI